MAYTSINIQITPIYHFKTSKKPALDTLKKYARLLDMSVVESLGGDYSQG